MDNNESDLNAKIDEYHLMVEEVLGGMDMMISRLSERLQVLETKLESSSDGPKDDGFTSVKDEINTLRNEVTEGLKLAFIKISEK